MTRQGADVDGLAATPSMKSTAKLAKVGALASNAIASALPQLSALLLLDGAGYGNFSFAYLVYALTVSWLLSIVCEPRVILRAKTVEREYLSALNLLSLLGGAIAFGAILVIGDIAMAIATALAVAFNASYFGHRFNLVYDRRWSRAICMDICFVTAMAVGIIFVWLRGAGEKELLIVWAVGGAVSAVVSSQLRLPSWAGSTKWLRTANAEVRRLFPESLLMDLGAIGVPFVLFPFMGPQNFGIYRAISNVAFPVRIALLVVRPNLARDPARFVRSVSRNFAAHMVLIAIAALAFAAITLLGRRLVSEGILHDLLPYAGWAAAFVYLTGVGQLYYMCGRLLSTGGRLMFGRVVQTGLVVVFPVGGFAAAGLEGAIAGFVLSAGISAVLWFILAVRPRRVQGSAS